MEAKPSQPPPGRPVTLRPSFGARLRAYLMAGILVTAPIGVTLWIAWSLIDWIDGAVQGLIPARYAPENYLPFVVPGFGVLVLVGGLTLIGMLTAGFIGRLGLRFAESLVARMPIVRSIYNAAKQIFETVLAARSTAFREVVLVETPRRGMWSLGFVTGRTEGEVQELTEDEVVNVFIPTTPNVTTGFLIFVPRHEVVPLEMTPEEGLKMLVSGGIVTPPERPPELAAPDAPSLPSPAAGGPA